MKILHFIYDHVYNPWVGGGGAVRCYELNKRLSEKGHHITVVSGNYPNAKNYVEGNIEFKFLGSTKNYLYSVFSYAFESIKFLKNYAKNYDLVVEDFAPWNPIFSFKYHKKVVLQIHQREKFEIFKRYFIAGLPFMFIEKFYPMFFKNVVGVSEISLNKFGIKGKVIPNGIDKSIIQNNIILGDYICFIGRIDIYNKGLDLLLNSVKDLGIKLKIAGKGKDIDKLYHLIDSLGLKNKVEITGYLKDKEKLEFLKNSIFVVMPSRYEAQGIVALEAAALGKPVIVSDIPELKYVVDNGFGIAFKKENYKDLRDKMAHLLSNKDLILKMGKNGIEYAKNYTWDKLAGEYEKFLIEILRND